MRLFIITLMGLTATSVLVKVLRTGDICSAILLDNKGTLLEMDIAEDDQSLRIPGELVEIRVKDALYLGELRSRNGKNTTVRCEHFIDLKVLGEIRDRWDLPAEADYSPAADS